MSALTMLGLAVMGGKWFVEAYCSVPESCAS